MNILIHILLGLSCLIAFVAQVHAQGTPSSLSAKANPEKVALSWTPSGSYDGHNVLRCEGTDCTPAYLAWVDSSTSTNYYEDSSSITSGTTYRYTVQATLTGMAGAWSNQVNVTAVAPGAPSGLRVKSDSGTEIVLEWTPPSDNGGGDLDGYNIHRCEGAGCTPSYHAWVSDGSSSTYTDSGVTEGTTYRYAVESRRVSWGSSWAHVTARGPVVTEIYTAPSAPREFVARASDNLVALNWKHPWWRGTDGLQSYTLYRAEGNSCEKLNEYRTDISPSTEYFEDTDIIVGRSYCYQLAGRNFVGEGKRTDIQSVVSVNLGDPQALTVVTGNTAIIGLSWTPSPEDGGGPVDGYNVYRCVGSDCVLTSNDWLAWVPVYEETSYADRGLATGTEYRYAVGAVRAKVFSGWTNEVTFRPGAAIVVQPGSTEIMPVTIVGAARTTTGIISIKADSGVPDGTLLELPPIDESLSLWAVDVTSENAEGSTPGAPTGLVHAVDRLLKIVLDNRGIGGSIKALPSAATICIPMSRIGAGANPGTVALYRTTSDGQSWTALDVVYRPGMVCGATQQFTRFAVFGTPSARMSAELQARGSAHRVALDWIEAVFGGDTEVTRYTLYRGDGDTCDNLGVIQEGLARHLRYTEDNSVSVNATYCYRLTATGSTDERLESNDAVVRAVTASMPADLQVTTSNETMIGLRWTAPADDGGGPLNGYNVYRCEGADCQFEGETWLAWVTDGTAYTDDGSGSRPLNSQATYRYAVAASRADELSDLSNWVTASATEDGDEGEPEISTAALRMVARGSSFRVALDWSAPVLADDAELSGYTLYRGDGDACDNLVAIQTGLAPELLYAEDNSVSTDATYCYRLTATDSADATLESNDEVVRAVAPSMPTDLQVTASSTSAIGLSWTAPSDDGGGPPYGYNVYRCEGGDCQFEGETWLAWVTDGTTYTDDGNGSRPLISQATYRYAVATSRAGELSVWSNWVTTSATEEGGQADAAVPSAPTGLLPSGGSSKVALSWQAPEDTATDGLTGYTLYRSGEGSCENVEAIQENLAADITNVEDDTVTADTTYCYRVSASNEVGEGAQSNDAVVRTVSPSTPTNLQVTASSADMIGLSWTAPADDGGGPLHGYNLYRCEGANCEFTDESWLAWVADGTTYTDDGSGARPLVAQTTYGYAVAASRAGDNSERSGWKTATVGKAVDDGSGDPLSTAENQALEDVSVSMARSMLSSVIPTIRRRFGETSDLSSISIAGRNAKPGLHLEEWASTSQHAVDALPSADAPWHAVGSGSGTSFVDSSGWGLVPTAFHGPSSTHSARAADRSRHGALGGAQLLNDSHFALGFGGSADHDPSWTLWGSSDVQYFGGESGDSSRFEGEMLTGHFGIDAKVGGNHLLGLAITHSIGDADFLTTDRDGRVGMELTTVLPYGRFLFNEQTEAWIILGTGSGERTAVIGDDLQQSVQLTPQVSAFGGRRKLGRGPNGISWEVRGDAASLRLQSDDSFSVGTHRVRLGLEGSSTFVLQNAATVQPFVEMSLRVDGGDGSINGTGVEIVGGVQYRHPASRFWLETQGRALMMRSAGEYEERGYSLTAGFQPRDDGTGLSLRFSPQWGASATSTHAFWRDDALDDMLGHAFARRQQGRSWRAEVGYGLFAPHTGGLLTPFGELNVLSETQRQGRLGARYLNSTDVREVSFEVSSDIVTTALPGIGTPGPRDESDVQIRFRGQIRF